MQAVLCCVDVELAEKGDKRAESSRADGCADPHLPLNGTEIRIVVDRETTEVEEAELGGKGGSDNQTNTSDQNHDAVVVVLDSDDKSLDSDDTSLIAIFKNVALVLVTCGGDEAAIARLMKHRVVAICFLVTSIFLPVSDTSSDVALTYEWLQPDSGDEWFGKVSLAILCVSTFMPAVLLFFFESHGFGNFNGKLYDWDTHIFNPVFGIVLSITQMRLPVMAALSAYDIAINGVSVIYLEGPAERGGDIEASVLSGASGILFIKMFELLCETTAELTLQFYKNSYDYFVKDEAPPFLLQLSISISLCTMAFGCAGTFLNLEHMPTKICATCYFLSCLVARFAVMTSLFIEFGKPALGWVVGAFCLRIGMTVARVHEGNWMDTLFVGGLIGVFDHLVTFFLPLGTAQRTGPDALIALIGPSKDPIVTDKITSITALATLAVTLVENAIGWLCIRLVNSETDIPLLYFERFGLVPMGLMLVFLALTRLSTAKLMMMN